MIYFSYTSKFNLKLIPLNIVKNMNVLNAEKYSLDSKFFDIFDDDFSPDDDADKLYRTLKGKK